MNRTPILSSASSPDGGVVGGYPGVPGEDAFSFPPVLLQYWHAAQRWRWLIAGIIAAAVLIGLIVTLLAPPQFTARSQIEISREQQNVTNVPGLEGAGAPRDLEFYDTQYALLKAESLAERIVRNLKLADDDGFFEAHGVTPPEAAQRGAGKPVFSKNETRQRERQATRLLLDHVDIRPIRNSRLVDINYISRTPTLSARIANAWPQQFIGATMDRQFASSADARSFLEQRLTDLRARLEQSERDAVAFASERDIVTLGATRDASGRTMDPRTLVASDLEALNAALVSARTDRIAAESQLRAKGAEHSAQALTNPTIQQLRQKRAEVGAEYAKLMVQFEPGYPAARALKEQMKTLDAAIARETGRVSGSQQLAYDEAVTREQKLAAQVEELKTRLDRQQHDTIQYNIFQRDADTNRQLYDSLLQRYKEIGVAGSVGATNIAVVDLARVPERPSGPSLPKNLAIALLLGIVLAAGAVFTLEQIDEGIRNPTNVESLLALPLLGAIPQAREDAAQEARTFYSQLGEAYFSTRTALALATTHGLPRTLAVTSTQPGEGKSISALGLACAIGRQMGGKKVLLLDADMRSPSVHTLTNVRNEGGLSLLLAGEENILGQVQSTHIPELAVLTAGPTPPSAAELLSTDRFHDVLDGLLERYDHIVVDCPPILGLADAPLIGRAVEGSVLVIEAESASVRSIRNALRRLQVGHNHVYGALVTKLDVERAGQDYGLNYAGYYSYGGDSAFPEAKLSSS
ncbi:putative exopolysaccharide biosynthesis protein [Caenibius tardaugens NBRC 16725]|uniref:non-specific protein-tyrosine kinase n=1 Tax=Caenibius tardaugens NBRC 16725 TaxID=1219035 RepID=U2ZZQ4_9SPHN|nr:polysaccharide biosynthesis tyrosine autokinase [Caenibius tardaugens]AZI36351.1 polysaccharide biosynthesis tyrosine autokinase [Caenibius tardaugens NBRC 16725]GAD50849.1 putative exopolysaccharide biosynthesis protein [Caenibius tardaugens NBRC 16725]